MIQALGVFVKTEESQDMSSAASFEEGATYFHGDWLVSKCGRLLLVGHGKLKVKVEWNCAGWGAAFVTVNDECYSLYSDGRVLKTRAIREYPEASRFGKSKPIEDEYQVLNVAIGRQREVL